MITVGSNIIVNEPDFQLVVNTALVSGVVEFNDTPSKSRLLIYKSKTGKLVRQFFTNDDGTYSFYLNYNEYLNGVRFLGVSIDPNDEYAPTAIDDLRPSV